MLQKNVANQYVFFGLVNASTGAGLAGATVSGVRTLDTGAQGAVTGTFDNLGGGQYRFNASQADTNGNFVGYFFTATNAVPVSANFITIAATAVTGVPTVDVADWKGSAPNALISGRVDADAEVVGDKTGYSLTQSFPANFASLSIDAGGNVKVQTGIKKNVALAKFEFIMTDATTHAPVTGKAVTATRNIDNAGFAACANAVTEVANGWYVIDFAATDLNGNVIAFRMTAAGADDTDFTIVTDP